MNASLCVNRRNLELLAMHFLKAKQVLLSVDLQDKTAAEKLKTFKEAEQVFLVKGKDISAVKTRAFESKWYGPWEI